MDTQTIVFIILFLVVAAGFILLLIMNSGADRNEKEILAAARRSGWKPGKQAFSGITDTGINWSLELSNEGQENSLFWHTEDIRLKGNLLAILPALVLPVLTGKSSKMAFRMTGRGKNWLKPGIKTLQLALERGGTVQAGSDRFRQRYSIYANNTDWAKSLLTPEVEALLMDFPVQAGQPFTPVYVLLNPTELQVFAETSDRNMEVYTHLVNLGAELSTRIQALQEL